MLLAMQTKGKGANIEHNRRNIGGMRSKCIIKYQNIKYLTFKETNINLIFSKTSKKKRIAQKTYFSLKIYVVVKYNC